MKKVILILAANPEEASRLRLDQEVREINNGLVRAQRRDDFKIEQQWAVRPVDVRRAMLDYHPNIVHFSGHGNENGIVFEDDSGHGKLIETEALAGLFELFSDSIECVVLNACYSEVQARAIAKNINYVVGMNQEIGDKAAIEFSSAFYDAIGAGKTFEFAFRLGRNALQLAGIPEHLTPELITKNKEHSVITRSSSSSDEIDIEIDNFNSFSSGRKRTGVIVHIYWHKYGLTLENATIIKQQLEKNDISASIMQHRNDKAPDSIFIGALVGAQEAKIILSNIPYQIRYIFPLNYPRTHGGDPNGLLVGIGYISTHSPTPDINETIPVKISQLEIELLTESGISNTEFQKRLRNIASFR